MNIDTRRELVVFLNRFKNNLSSDIARLTDEAIILKSVETANRLCDELIKFGHAQLGLFNDIESQAYRIKQAQSTEE